GAVQAGRSHGRTLARFLSTDGWLGVRRRWFADLARALAELRDEMGAARFHARRPAAALLGQFPGGAWLDRSCDAALPAWLAAPTRRGGGSNRPQQLPAADADLYYNLLRSRPRLFRRDRPRGPAPDRARHLDVPAAGVVRVAPLVCTRTGGVGAALGDLRT